MSASSQQTAISSATSSGTAKDLRKQQVDKAHHARQIQALNLQRENILSQRTSNAGRRAALEAALAHVEAQIEALK